MRLFIEKQLLIFLTIRYKILRIIYQNVISIYLFQYFGLCKFKYKITYSILYKYTPNDFSIHYFIKSFTIIL
jgi:hypothetical protein